MVLHKARLTLELIWRMLVIFPGLENDMAFSASHYTVSSAKKELKALIVNVRRDCSLVFDTVPAG